MGESACIPPPDAHFRRRIFGIRRKAPIHEKGIQFLGVWYQHDELQRQRRNLGKASVEMRIDPKDLGVVSVRINGVWYAIPSIKRSFAGVSLWDWEETLKDLRLRYAKEAELAETIVFAAIDRIQEIDRDARMRAGHKTRTEILKDIQRAESLLPRGFKIRDLDGGTPRQPLPFGAAGTVVDPSLAPPLISNASIEQGAGTARPAKKAGRRKAPNAANPKPSTARNWSFE
jgi:putative transposase